MFLSYFTVYAASWQEAKGELHSNSCYKN